jgi:CRISPR-associated RAMP protein (TIGR02581 family)
MLKRLVNEAWFDLTITTRGPVLIKSGYATLIGPDMTPVLTARQGTMQVYLPGSSLKGTFRSHVEKVIGTLRPDPPIVCNPFQRDQARDQSCSEWLNRRPDRESITNAVAYRDECPACRLFGSTWFIGRVSIDDAYLVDSSQPRPTEQRDGVGIDRLTGGAVHGAKFDLEVVAAEVQFQTRVLLRNFECWQLGAIILVVQDLEDQLIRLGSGKSRGLGSVQGSVSELHIAHLGPTPERAPSAIWGLGRFLGAQSEYGTAADDEMTVAAAPNGKTRGLRTIQTFRGEALAALKQTAIAEFVQRMNTYPRLNRQMERAV